MTTNNERRNSPRVPCQGVWLEIKVSDQAGPASARQMSTRQVRVDNISSSGLCLISAEPFELGQTIYFSDPNLPAQGTVVWTCQSKIDCKGGIQFIP